MVGTVQVSFIIYTDPLSFFGVFVVSALATHGNIVSYFATGLSETCAMFIRCEAETSPR